MDLKDIKVELRPHVATERKVVGGAVVEIPVHFPQCYVMVNGKQVGYYCGAALDGGKYEPNMYLSFIEPQPLVVQQAIAEAVAKLTGGVKGFNAPPPDEHDEVVDDGE